MDKRLFLAVLLSIGVIFGYYTVFPPAPPQERQPEQPAPATQPAQQQAAVRQDGPQSPAPQAKPPARPAAPRVQARPVVVETPRYVARIDTRGGRLVSFKLKHYKVGKEIINWGDIIPPLRSYLSKPAFDPGENMEMVKNELREVDMLDVAFAEDPRLTLQVRNIVFAADRERVRIAEETDRAERVVLTGKTKEGLTIKKILTFQPDSYIVDYEVQVINYSGAPMQLRVVNLFGEGPDSGAGGGNIRSFYGPIFREDDSVDTEDPDDIGEKLIVRAPQWLGITANYFITAAAPESRIDHALFRSTRLISTDGEERWAVTYGMELPAVLLNPDNMISGKMRLYLGPKQASELEKFSDGLEESIQQTIEMLSPLSNGLLAILHWFQGFTGNYGLSIILLTMLVRIALFPLTYKGMVSMRRMSKLQPKMKALREKYGKDKERINREMMAMYKRYKINPLGGCLPILVQMPIFFALYSALLSAIELRHAPFVAWLTDLSAMDHLYITPLMMGASMFLQQKLTPTSMDPAQQKILMFMPLIFMIFMFSFPSGLVLYWVTSNILSILQQVIINRAHIPDLVDPKN